MFLLHKLLAKLGCQIETYKTEIFKSKYPKHVIISTKVYDAMGITHGLMDYSWKEYRIANINGQGVYSSLATSKKPI